tara:strand:+ start:1132 stop:1431 length:300 start_codon:yes stop_codon:yes gene_type:complete
MSNFIKKFKNAASLALFKQIQRATQTIRPPKALNTVSRQTQSSARNQTNLSNKAKQYLAPNAVSSAGSNFRARTNQLDNTVGTGTKGVTKGNDSYNRPV